MQGEDVKQEIRQLKQWIKNQGFYVHPAVNIPDYFNGIQGIGTKQLLPHKTVILSVPSQKIITVKRCFEDPNLKPLFQSNDDMFDYQSDQQAEFKILCVFLMYHKIHIDKSPWKAYLKTIAAPQTAVDWQDKQLIGLNKSLIEEILHVRKQCKKVQEQICTFLCKTKQFKHLTAQQLRQLFRICYKSVLTRCFGYYFSTACMIPIADLMNHHCNSVDHQLIHLQYEMGKGFHQSYRQKKNKLNCELMGLQKPNRALTLPSQLQYLIDNNLIQNTTQALSKLTLTDIFNHINKHIQQQITITDNNQEDNNNIQSHKILQHLQLIDFCELDDQQDNDTDSETQYNNTKNIENITKQQKQMMAQFKESILQVQTYGEVEKRVYQQFPEEKSNDRKKQQQAAMKNKIEVKQYLEAEGSVDNSCDYKSTSVSSSVKNQQLQKKQETNKQEINKQETNKQETNKQERNQQLSVEQQIRDKQEIKKAIYNRANIASTANSCPVSMPISSDQESDSGSEEEQWCLDPSCYFSMSTCVPVAAGAQLFNSYGSRTNKFLLVWYGFAYRDNLYDSVTLRMQALFSPSLSPAKQIVLDTYIGGQGLCFRKNEHQQVRPEQVSRQFRLKRSSLSKDLIMYLRLYLINYYKGNDLYKLFVTFPSSLQFELFMFRYYRDIVLSIYETRYPIENLKHLRQLFNEQTNPSAKKRIQFKIIYLEEQRKILDINLQAVNQVIRVLYKLQKFKAENNSSLFDASVYGDVKIEILRVLKDYFVMLKNNYEYICYEHTNKQKQTKNEKNVKKEEPSIIKTTVQPKKQSQSMQNKNKGQQKEEDWVDCSDQQNMQQKIEQ